MAKQQTYLTPAGLKQLSADLELLKSVRRSEVAARIHKATESGGTVDNAEYDEAKNEQAFIEGRIRDLENVLSNAVLAPRQDEEGNSVEFGSKVTVVTSNGRKRQYRVVGSAEAAPLEGKISNESPVGRAILGRKVGDELEVETPSGKTKITITRIR